VNNFTTAAYNAGRAVKDFRQQNHAKDLLNITLKSDCSPVTQADMMSHDMIIQHISHSFPDIPIISEEMTHHNIKTAKRFILIDPIDGTRSYIDGTNDYTINIALIENNRPVAGVIYVPEDDDLFFASQNNGAYTHKGNNIHSAQKITVSPVLNQMIVTISPYGKNCFNIHDYDIDYPVHGMNYTASAKKFTLIASGIAHLYPRLGQTGEWDTASGDIILHESGGYLRTLTGEPIIYGKKDFINDGFLAYSDIDIVKSVL
jgi:3'(2'),5'-bisphosphate nucleotidase